MKLDPDKIGVWVPFYISKLAPSGGAALLLAQLTWLLQENTVRGRRSSIVEVDDVDWIARTDSEWEDVGFDRLTAMRARNALVRAGLIEVRQGSANGRKSTLLRPCYDVLAKARIRTIDELELSRGYAPTKARNRATESAEPRDPSLLIDQTLVNQPQTEAVSVPLIPGPTFDDFWTVYPRHEEKKAARQVWERTVRSVDPAVVVAGAARYRDDPNRVAAYTKQPTTWLNQGCWDDDPLPPRLGAPGSSSAGPSPAAGIMAQLRREGATQ